jgi:hypothetical protein
VRFKVVFEEEPVTRMMQFTLIRPPAEIQKSHARLALGERELKSDDGSIWLMIKDYDFLVARGMTWGGRIKCDISVKRTFNPRMAIYSPKLSFYREMLPKLESAKTEGISVWVNTELIPGIIEPPAFMAPITTTLAFTGEGNRELKEPVRVELKVDWFPEELQPVPGLTPAEAQELSAKRFQYKTLWVFPKETFKVVFELPDWVTKKAKLYYFSEEERDWIEIGVAEWDGVNYPHRVKLWDSWLENLSVEFDRVWRALETQKKVFEEWSENAVKTAQAMLTRIEEIENKLTRVVQNVGESFKRHENLTRAQLEMLKNFVIESFKVEHKPMVVIYAPQVAYAGVPNTFFVKEINCHLTGITVEDGSGVLWSGALPFFTLTPRVPGSGLKLTVTYTAEYPEWAGSYTKTVEIPFVYLTSITWENQQPVVAPPPEPVLEAWHLLLVATLVFVGVLGIGLWRKR